MGYEIEDEVEVAVTPDPLRVVWDELQALDRRALSAVNCDVQQAASTVLSAMPALRKLRPAMVVRFGEADAAVVDRLELLAHAAIAAAARHEVLLPGPSLEPLADELFESRELLASTARSLIARKLLPRNALDGLPGTRSYASTISEVAQLVLVFQLHWAEIARPSGLEESDLVRAEARANRLVVAVSQRDQKSCVTTDDVKQRAYTLLASTYDDARRMVGYLRWREGDADRVAPSFFAARYGRKSRATSSDPPPEATPLPPEVAAMPGGNPFPRG